MLAQDPKLDSNCNEITPLSIDNHAWAGNVGVPYSFPLQATGGKGPYSSWSVDAGALPDGLTLDPDTGVISGTPTTPGTYQSRVDVTDDLGFAGGTLLYLRIVGGSCAPHSCAVAAGPGQVTVNLALVSGPGYYLAYVADLHHEGSDPAAVYGSTGLVDAGGYTFSSLTRGDVYFFIVSVYEYVYNSQTNTWHLGSISGEITNEVAAP